MSSLVERRRQNLNKTTTAVRLCSQNLLIWGLRFFWVVLLLLGELGAFFWSIRGCRWPDDDLPSAKDRPAHILLVGDAQVRPLSSLENANSSILSRVHDHLYHAFLKRSWHVATRLKPHTVIFLGDMLAMGRRAHKWEEFKDYYDHFERIFPTGPNTPKFYLPGNADVGLGMTATSKDVRRHYQTTFGPFNTELSIRNHTLILLDAPALVEEDYARATRSIPYEKWPPIRGGTVEFLKSRKVHTVGNLPPDPVLLFSHIPMSRPDAATCGPLREKGRIRRGVGKGYQTMFGKDTTFFLFDLLNPIMVFSADDRDYCDHVHQLVDPTRSIPETTIKSFSQARHITRPGFQLLSLSTPPLFGISKVPTFAHTSCLLPDQAFILHYIYVPVFLLTLFILLLTNIYRSRKNLSQLPPISLSSERNVKHKQSTSPLLLASPTSSNVWTPFSPFAPTSPRSELPLSLRTPVPNGNENGHSRNSSQAVVVPSLRAYSRPATPSGSGPFLSPMSFPRDDDMDEGEDNDHEASMYPTQYAPNNHQPLSHNRHMSNNSLDFSDHRSTYFVPAPQLSKLGLGSPSGPANGSVESNSHKGWSKSWTFIFRGRRQRMTVSMPRAFAFALNQIGQLWLVITGADLPKYQRKLNWGHVLKGTARDGFAVVWVVGLCWIGIEWRMF